MSLNDTIANLLVEQGRLKGQGAAASGQVWGSALSNIGKDVGQAINDAPKRAEQVAEADDAKRAREARKAFSDAMKSAPPVEQNGLKLYDVQGIGKIMSDKGYGPEFAAAAPHLDTINQSTMQFQQGRMGLVQANAAAALAAGADPELTVNALEHMKGNQVYSDQTIDGWIGRIKDNPADTVKILQFVAGPQKPTVLHEGDVAFDATNAPIPGMSVPKTAAPLNPEDKALKEGQLKEITAKLSGDIPMTPKEKADLQLQQARLRAETSHWANQDAAAEAAPTLTPEGLDAAALQWAMTGQMVPMGMGKAGAKVRTDIINRAAEKFKGLNLPSQQAAYAANKGSLVRTQGTLDNLTAFEKAAGKNIDTFIDLTKNLPDSGVPWANMPLRLLSDKMVGNEYLPALNAARQIATREVARVVNDPGLKGELTDSARKGVDDMMSGDITIAQLKQVLPVLKGDMANVHQSLGEQLKDIQNRIATPPGEEPVTTPKKLPDTVLPGFTIQRGQ